MKTPEFRTTKCKKTFHWIDKHLESGVIKYFFGPLFFVVPFGFVSKMLTDDKIYNSMDGYLGAKFIIFLKDHQVLLFIIIATATVIISAIRQLIKHCAKPNSQIDRDELVGLFDCLNVVVQAKSGRYLKNTPDAINEKWGHEKILTQSANPEQQIALLTVAVKGYFEFLSNNQVFFRTGLMRINNDKPVEWFTFAPQEHPPRTTPESLSAPTSAIMKAIETGRLVVIPNMDKELSKRNKDVRRCIRGATGDQKRGSLLTYPIYCANTKKVIYVLSVLGDRNDSLLEEEWERYNWILDHFGTRIILEHHLMLMMEAAA